jgi:Ca-activated chloride channel family protein
MRRITTLCALACLAAALLAGGTGAFGRVALAIGLPRLAAALFSDPAWQGVAFYRAGDFDAAAAALGRAGPDALYNLGNAQAHRGAYAASLEAFDLALARGYDPQAQANFDLLRAFYTGTAIDADAVFLTEDRDGTTMQAPVARGDARGSGTGADVTNTGATLGLAELTTEGREQRVRYVFDDKFITANARWLATLEDVPGAYLNERISHEHKRRRTEGIGQIAEDTEW